ncbi:MAG: hypothetical protein GF364_21770 [Candidatus Lokiarchaeota archaeon]|nr:hypothetical protein [Candidatus Lokiarchaeota archaeon]
MSSATKINISIIKNALKSILKKKNYDISEIKRKKKHIQTQLKQRKEISHETACDLSKIITRNFPEKLNSSKINTVELIEIALKIYEKSITKKKSKKHNDRNSDTLSIKVTDEILKLNKNPLSLPDLTPSFLDSDLREEYDKNAERGTNIDAVESGLIAYTLSDSNTEVFKVAIVEKYHNDPGLSGSLGFANIHTTKVIGYFCNVYTSNVEASKNSHEGTIEIASAVRGVVQNTITRDIKFADFIVIAIRSDLGLQRLGNSPDTYTKIYKVDNDLLDDFYLKKNKHYIRFAKSVKSGWFYPVELQKFVFYNTAIIASIRMGKGYLTNPMILSAVGQPIITGKNREKPLAVVYFDYNGQWATDEFHFFRELDDDPRVIINAKDVGVNSVGDLIIFLFNQFSFNQIGFSEQKIKKIRDYLKDNIDFSITYSKFLSLLEHAIKTAYESNAKKKYEKLKELIEQRGGSNFWNNKILPKLKAHNDAYRLLDESIKNGKLVIINLGNYEPEQKPSVTYKILKYLFRKASEAYIKNDHEEYVYSTMLFFDEAHNFAPENGKSNRYPYEKKCKTLLKSISTDASKYGLGLGLITQRPARLSKDVLGNIRNLFIGSITSIDGSNQYFTQLLAGKDPSKLNPYQFYAHGDACPVNGEIIKSFDPKDLAKELKKRK